MSREKQIEEMAKAMCLDCAEDSHCSLAQVGGMCSSVRKQAAALYSAGYRKQSEGEWIDQYQGKYVNQLYKCSICGDTAFHDDKRWFLTPYCHNCGAKMKGGSE